MPGQTPDESHYAAVIDSLGKGRLIPFFGAGANLSNRPNDYDWKQPWRPTSGFLPSGEELSHRLADQYKYPGSDSWNLLRVSQYIAAVSGETALDETIQEWFNHDYSITPLHDFFARVPGTLRERGYDQPHQLIVTTNYDDLMERSLAARGEDYDVISYIRDGDDRGKFEHYCSVDEKSAVVDSANEYEAVTVEARPVVLKIHGAVDRSNNETFNFVITEDNYIDYLTQGEVVKRIPILLRERFHRCQFLFLGYGLADWNMRAFFKAVQSDQRARNKRLRSWAVQQKPDLLEERFWDDRGVTIFDKPLGEYVNELENRMNSALPVVRGNA